jgi:hypothetical protein
VLYRFVPKKRSEFVSVCLYLRLFSFVHLSKEIMDVCLLERNVFMKAFYVGLLSLCAVLVCVPATAQNATIWDGNSAINLTRVVPLEVFNTEGPVWDLECNDQSRGGTVRALGKTVTIPWLLNGAPMACEATSDGYSDSDGGEIMSDEYCKMTDAASTRSAPGVPVNATGEAAKQGAVRSWLSTAEARGRLPGVDTSILGMVNQGTGAQGDVVQAELESNFANMIASVYPSHAAFLPADFLARVGGSGGIDDVANWAHPQMNGGTFKSAGHVYQDGAGNRYLIPDTINVYELSENTNAGEITSLAIGQDGAPDSFVIEDMLFMFNPDPRFPSVVLGVADQEIPRDTFFQNFAVGSGIDMIGYVVGEHVMFAMEVLTDLINIDGVIEATVERWRFRDDGNEIRFRGAVDEASGLGLTCVAMGCNALGNFSIPFGIALEVEPNGAGHFAARLEFDLIPAANTADVTHIRLEVRQASTGNLLSSETFDRNEVDPDNPTATVCDAIQFEAECNDGLDNDLDGQADCDDSDCTEFELCDGATPVPNGESDANGECSDGLDNDSDGLADCADADCNGDTPGTTQSADCIPVDVPGGLEETCSDGEDNDADGLTDCDDPDCEGEPGPAGTADCTLPPVEECDDGADNDGDGLVDCADSDCDASEDCPAP